MDILNDMYRYCKAVKMGRKEEHIIHAENLIKTVVENDTVMFSFEDNRTVITFAGSNDFRDWISNLKFFKSFNKSNISEGFENSFFDIYSKKSKHFQRAIFAKKPICITGHSRGGALSIVCSYYLCKFFDKEDISCITFGSPKVGGEDFLDKYSRMPVRCTEVINPQDSVTGLPFRVFGFRHIGLRHFIKPKWYHYFSGIKAHTDYGKYFYTHK